MIAPLAENSWVLSHHVDSLEISCTFQQVSILLLTEGTDWKPGDGLNPELDSPLQRDGAPPLCKFELELELARIRAGCHARSRVIDLDWGWTGSAEQEQVRLLAKPIRAGYAYSLETADWLMLVAPAASFLPKMTFQFRSDYLKLVGPQAAFRETTAWASKNAIPLMNGTPRETVPAWRISRIDLAADIAGVEFEARDLERFTTKSRRKQEHHEAQRAGATQLGRVFTGFTLGSRGGSTFARVYDKTVEAEDSALIRQVWTEAGYDPEKHGPTIWRVEFEVRSSLLREMLRSDGSRIHEDPLRLLSEDLDDLWRYLVGTWLRLRTSEGSERMTKRPVEPWWSALVELDGLSEQKDYVSAGLAREATVDHDREDSLKMALSYLAIAASTGDDHRLDHAIGFLAEYAVSAGGQEHFCNLVARAEARRDPRRSGSRSAINARGKELQRLILSD